MINTDNNSNNLRKDRSDVRIVARICIVAVLATLSTFPLQAIYVGIALSERDKVEGEEARLEENITISQAQAQSIIWSKSIYGVSAVSIITSVVWLFKRRRLRKPLVSNLK